MDCIYIKFDGSFTSDYTVKTFDEGNNDTGDQNDAGEKTNALNGESNDEPVDKDDAVYDMEAVMENDKWLENNLKVFDFRSILFVLSSAFTKIKRLDNS